METLHSSANLEFRADSFANQLAQLSVLQPVHKSQLSSSRTEGATNSKILTEAHHERIVPKVKPKLCKHL
jgi:hypothetical protein